MVKVYSLDGFTPVVHPTAYVHPSAVLIGDVIIGPNCYVGPGASLRGDFGRIVLGEGCNVQDNCVMHSFPEVDTVVEDDGHIGHGAILHACRVGRNCLIGMNTVVMDGAVVGENAMVAAMSFVSANTQVPPNTLFAGIPAKVMRELKPDEIEWKSKGTFLYQALAARSLHSMQEVEALTEPEADRKKLGEVDIVPFYVHRMRQTGG